MVKCLCSDTMSDTFPFLENRTCLAAAACPTIAAYQSGMLGQQEYFRGSLGQDFSKESYGEWREHQEVVISKKKE